MGSFDHEKLDVYQAAIKFVGLADGIVKGPRAKAGRRAGNGIGRGIGIGRVGGSFAASGFMKGEGATGSPVRILALWEV